MAKDIGEPKNFRYKKYRPEDEPEDDLPEVSLDKIAGWMIIVLLIFILLLSYNTYAQEDIEKYKLYPTENIHIYLKLDTSTGLVWMVQKASSDVESREEPINIFQIAYEQWEIDTLNAREGVDWEALNEYSGSEEPLVAQIGRFKLYPTQNIWNFLLQDVINGDTYQVQWSFNFFDNQVFKIK